MSGPSWSAHVPLVSPSHPRLMTLSTMTCQTSDHCGADRCRSLSTDLLVSGTSLIRVLHYSNGVPMVVPCCEDIDINGRGADHRSHHTDTINSRKIVNGEPAIYILHITALICSLFREGYAVHSHYEKLRRLAQNFVRILSTTVTHHSSALPMHPIPHGGVR
ncbi:hypothetical protein Hypma_004645 [Hypsizygus marmoreus]|uniref:Uncharacterized protein n=1 Tax=Hypsizygus marmoreus TaxID=39966 RepID=A0A369J939_HYPMA|nr:hypothetical protein Hypma_004645 [Hypsizygus marmoreus]